MDQKEYIKHRIIGAALSARNSSTYNYDTYEALEATAWNLYYYVKPKVKVMRRESESDFCKRLLDYVLYSAETLKPEEIAIISRYYGGTRSNVEYAEPTFEVFREAVEEHRAEFRRLTGATAELRKLDKGCFPFSILERIGDYISYYEQVQPVDRLILYARIYNIGRVEGIRAERARRKARKEKSDRKETSPHTTE